MKKLFIILGALLFTTMIYLFISNIIIPSVITEGTIGIHGEKLSGTKLTEVIESTRKVALIPCIIFLSMVLRILTESQNSENKD